MKSSILWNITRHVVCWKSTDVSEKQNLAWESSVIVNEIILGILIDLYIISPPPFHSIYERVLGCFGGGGVASMSVCATH
jgi:hypothetical protein